MLNVGEYDVTLDSIQSVRCLQARLGSRKAVSISIFVGTIEKVWEIWFDISIDSTADFIV